MPFTFRRKAARVVVFDPQDRLLLINARDPGDPTKAPWWEIPGGGIDPGEPTEHCVLRELHEEAGITDAVIGPVVWTQSVEFRFGGWHFEQDEWIHVARCSGACGEPGGLESLEALAFGEQRWWALEEVLEAAADGTRFIPYRLPEHLPGLLAALADGGPGPVVDITPDEGHIAAWNRGGGGCLS